MAEHDDERVERLMGRSFRDPFRNASSRLIGHARRPFFKFHLKWSFRTNDAQPFSIFFSHSSLIVRWTHDETMDPFTGKICRIWIWKRLFEIEGGKMFSI